MPSIDESQGYVYVEGRRLRRGYTTGSSAAAASKAAAMILLGQGVPEYVDLVTPRGIPIHVRIEEHSSGEGWAQCAVRKDGGDDADDTNGALICSKVLEYTRIVDPYNYYSKKRLARLLRSNT